MDLVGCYPQHDRRPYKPLTGDLNNMAETLIADDRSNSYRNPSNKKNPFIPGNVPTRPVQVPKAKKLKSERKNYNV